MNEKTKFGGYIARGILSSVRNKVLLGTAVMIIFTSAVLSLQSSHRLREVVMEETQTEGINLATGLSSGAGQSMLLKDVSTMQTALEECRQKKGVAWAYLVSEQGEVVAFAFDPTISSDKAFPSSLLGKNTPANGQPGIMRLQVNDKEALDVSVPILGGALGSAHVGMDIAAASAVISAQNRAAVLTVILVLAAALVMLWWLLERVVGPIVTLTEVVKRIVEEGDLTQNIAVTSRDEVGRLAAYISEMVSRLRKVPLDLGRSAQLLSQAVEALEEATKQQDSTITRQATALQETQVTAEEIKQTSQTAARSAQGILEATQRADEIGKKGEDSVEQSLQSLSEMRAQVGEIANRIQGLGERTLQISDITNTVKELADQSNMLALNAAIEAVRAGEHGKGFSLVAREIRRLADQSIQATNRVREILESVSSAASSAVKYTESGSARIELGLAQAKASGDNLKALASMVRDNNAAVRQIASAVNQQNTGVGQVFTAVMDQSRMMDDTVKQLDNTLQSVATLKAVSKSVLEVVSSYKV